MFYYTNVSIGRMFAIVKEIGKIVPYIGINAPQSVIAKGL